MPGLNALFDLEYSKVIDENYIVEVNFDGHDRPEGA